MKFLHHPHVPSRVICWAKRVSPKLARILKYGRINPNTQKYWDRKYSLGKYQQVEDTRYYVIRKAILNMVPHHSKVLDVGCGTGRLMAMLKKHNECECVGIDISEAAVEMARQQGFEAFQCRLPSFTDRLVPEMFDVGIMVEVMEHLSYPLKTLERLSEFLKPGGRVIVSVPNDCMKPNEYDEHMHSFTTKDLRALIERVYTIEECQTVNTSGYGYLLVYAYKC